MREADPEDGSMRPRISTLIWLLVLAFYSGVSLG